MNIMNAIIVTLQTAAIPIAAVIMTIIVMTMMKKPGKTLVTDENSFKVTESPFWLIIAGFGLVAAAILVWLGTGHDEISRAITAYIVAGICAAVTIVTCYVYFRRQLTVDGDTLVYQPIWGKPVTCQAKSVGRIDRVESPRCEEFSFYNRSGKKLFEIQGYMVNSRALMKHMKKYPVKIGKLEAVQPKGKR